SQGGRPGRARALRGRGGRLHQPQPELARLAEGAGPHHRVHPQGNPVGSPWPGRGRMVWADIPADKEADFNRWYNEEHLAERMSVPGFLNAARYEAVKGGPKHLAVYELESPAVLESPGYKEVQANPTPWTKRCSPEVIGTTFIRNVYSMIH